MRGGRRREFGAASWAAAIDGRAGPKRRRRGVGPFVLQFGIDGGGNLTILNGE
jgi:hypothetical protein